MKTTANILLLILLTINFSYSQPDSGVFHSDLEEQSFHTLDPLQLLLAANPLATSAKYSEYGSELTDIVEKLQKKQNRWSSERVLEKMFYYAHRKQLDWYEHYLHFSDIFESGKYDCVTGTAFYALLMDRLGYEYTIYEFDYHVFLVARVGADSILLEATDPINGFVTDQKEIARRITLYGAGLDPTATQEISPVASQDNKASYHINNKISLRELAGLQYYNLSVHAFNDNDLHKANELIKKAKFLYPSYRIKEVNRIFAKQRNVVSN